MTENQFQVKLNYQDSQPPTRGSDEAAGYDLYSYESETVAPNQNKLIDTGISIKVPEGTYGRIAPRSGVSKKGILINAGVIDRDYRGPVKIMVHNLSSNDYVINKNDRIAQLILEQIKTPPMELVEELDDTVRGEGGFGSTGA
jgi:deoxyuridine 5'-triphosphate nucleotidohydrolase|tara:strand:+ start:1045 stop:1473 length:429 start_codon:yes stop_codon:yes gene_type:complete